MTDPTDRRAFTPDRDRALILEAIAHNAGRDYVPPEKRRKS